VNYWERQELELLRKENAYLDKLSPFQKLIDSHVGFILTLVLGCQFFFVIGVLIGFLL
jgi:hypothetical protein